jgi:hypothetical protein
METKNREKMLLIIVAACIGLWVVQYVLIMPVYHAWTGRQDKIHDLRTKIATGHITLASGPNIESQWNRMRTNTLSVNPTAAESQLYTNFQKWATASLVSLAGQKPEKKDSDDPAYSNEEWHADVTGSMAQIFAFLYSVESSPLGLRVDSVDLSSRDDAGQQLALGLTVSGLILNPDTNSVPNK